MKVMQKLHIKSMQTWLYYNVYMKVKKKSTLLNAKNVHLYFVKNENRKHIQWNFFFYTL